MTTLGLNGEGTMLTAERYVPPGTAPALAVLRPTGLHGVEVPERHWLVPNWIPMGGVVTGLYGAGGFGKTLLAQQLQTSTALGQRWLGQFAERVKSIGLYCEDSAEELHRRQNDINESYWCSFRELSDIIWLPRLGHDNMLMVFGSKGVGELTPLHTQVREASLDHGARLLVVDTAADTFGGSEIDRKQVRQFVAHALGSLAMAIDGAVVLCAHPSKDGLKTGAGDGGSSAWENTLRSRLYLTEPKLEEGEAPDRDARVLYRKKANYAARSDEIKLRWQNGQGHSKKAFHSMSDCADAVLGEDFAGFARGLGEAVQ